MLNIISSHYNSALDNSVWAKIVGNNWEEDGNSSCEVYVEFETWLFKASDYVKILLWIGEE